MLCERSFVDCAVEVVDVFAVRSQPGGAKQL